MCQCDLANANLVGADLSAAALEYSLGLKQSQLNEAYGITYSLPEGLKLSSSQPLEKVTQQVLFEEDLPGEDKR